VRRRIPRIGPRLNWAIIIAVAGGVLGTVGIGLLVCAATAIVGEGGGAAEFGLPGLATLLLGLGGLWTAKRLGPVPLRPRDGFVAVTLAWVIAAIAGAVPLLLIETHGRPLDALFESMAGFTTNGATLLSDVESEPDAVVLWRSVMQWLGGVGIVVLVVAIAPATGLATQRVFHAETTGITAERLTPRIAETAKIIAAIYVVLSVLAILSFWAAGMSLWDALNHGFTTVATGGFSTRSQSLGAFDSVPIELVAIVFMIAGGVNFAFYWRAMRGPRIWPQAAEVRAYLVILAGGIAFVTASLIIAGDTGGFGESLRAGAFSATSIITSTGFVTDDFDRFNDFARVSLLLLMFVGGCAGSTAGGMKVIRVLLLGKTAVHEVQRQLRPTAVQVLRTRGRVYSEEVRRGVLGFFFIYILVTVVGALALLAAGLDIVSGVSGAIATINVVGLAIGTLGPTENYAVVSDGGRAILCVLMLVGRLEVFTVLVLFTPAFWRPSVA
jgi:trk system potassium uptake protein TrkH